MAGSNLTNTFIANTYQKLLQVDNINGSVGTTAVFSIANAISSSKYNLLNGLGQTMPGFVIDTTGNGDGGLMFKDSNYDPGGLWSIQTFETSNSEGGLNFWRPSGVTNAANAKLFLKNTGSVWVGYQDSVNPTPVIPTDITGYSLYVKDGITSEKRVRTSSYNQNNVKDLWVSYTNSTGGVSLGKNEIYGVKKNEQIIIGGYVYIESNRPPLTGQGRFTQGNGKAARIKNSDGNYANSGNWWEILDGSGSLTSGAVNFGYADLIWHRVGPIVTVSFQITDFFGSDEFGLNGMGHAIKLYYPCVLLDDDNNTVITPTINGASQYFAAGSGCIYNVDTPPGGLSAEVKSISSIKWVLISSPYNDDRSNIRGTYQYLLY